MIQSPLLKLTQAIVLPAAVILLGCNSDKPVDTEQLLKESSQTLKDVDFELDRINSETDAISPVEDLQAKAKQPNTIYAKDVEGDLVYENLLVLKLLKEDDEWFLVSDRHTERLTIPSGIEDSREVPMGHYGLFVLTDDFQGNIGPGNVSASLEFGTHERSNHKHPLASVGDDILSKQDFAVVAFKAKLVLSKPDESEPAPRFFHGANHVGGMTAISERKAFVDKLQPGESGEFDGWHYLKVEKADPEESRSDE